MRLVRLMFLLGGLSLALEGCSEEGSGGASCPGGKCDDLDEPDSKIEAHPCDAVFEDESGRNVKRVINRLKDPLMDKVYRGITKAQDCPTTYAEIVARLRETDKTDCQDGFDEVKDKKRDGLLSSFVSETAQISNEPTSYRSVTRRECGGRDQHSLLFSQFGLALDRPLPGNVEIIAFDQSAGVFNFYEALPSGKVNFFGNSKDMVTKGPGPGEVRRCALCHPGGGLNMKELPAPWLHWEGDFSLPEDGADGTPGVTELLKKNVDLGHRSDGIDLESVVREGNLAWNKTRIELMQATGATADLLRPLFCTVEVNVNNGASGFSPPQGLVGSGDKRFDNLSVIPGAAIIDDRFGVFVRTSVSRDDYDALIKEKGQTIPGVMAAERDSAGKLTGKKVPAIDTVFDMYFVQPSGIDTDYVEQLQDKGLIDKDFMLDVLIVDFTRPVFSDDRCGLLEFAPALDNATLKSAKSLPKKLRDGFIANLKKKGVKNTDPTPAGVFLANLENTKDEALHERRVNRFVNRCDGLVAADRNGDVPVGGSRKLLEAVYTWITVTRNKARALPVFEAAANPATMPVNTMKVDPDTRLHPDTCSLVTEFVPGLPVAPPQTGQCEHNVCEAGEKLVSSCDPCAAQVCMQDSFCCDTKWDQSCVSAAAVACNLPCTLPNP